MSGDYVRAKVEVVSVRLKNGYMSDTLKIPDGMNATEACDHWASNEIAWEWLPLEFGGFVRREAITTMRVQIAERVVEAGP